MAKRSLLFLGLMLIGSSGFCADSTSRFVPPPGHVLLLVGQSVEDIQAYEHVVSTTPAGLMGYTSVGRAQGLNIPSNDGGGTQQLRKLVDHHPNQVLQIGLWMVNDCVNVAKGKMDPQLDRIGDWLRETHRPVYLREGYEFDGPHNHYPPQDYIDAFRHIVDRYRKNGITNVAFVWHSFASPVGRPLMDWYPGDEYVDWFAISYFNQPQRYMQPMVDLAKAHGKPVMIAEAAPWVIQTKYANAWNLWFRPLFKFIEANDIRALSYINCDWDGTPLFKRQRWGDTRLHRNPEILQQWLDETAQERYLKASPDLYKTLGLTRSAD
jgi:hypothetical protein